jgi:hypothetical protein
MASCLPCDSRETDSNICRLTNHWSQPPLAQFLVARLYSHMITSDGRSSLEVLLTIAGFFFALGYWIRRKEQAFRHRPQTSGVITTSTTLRESNGRGGEIITPVIEYEFTYAGNSFKSSHWSLLNFSISNSLSAQAVTSRYPVGSTVTVFVNPRNPMKSVLECRPSSLCWVLFGFGILFLSFSMLVLMINLKR